MFFNTHDDLHLWQWSTAGSLAIKNADAETMGVELEALWRPPTLPNLSLELGYAWLDAEFTNGMPIDPLDRTQGDPTLVYLKNFGADGYVAPVDQVLPLVAPAISAGAALPVWGVHDNGIPVYFFPEFLQAFGVETSNGIPADLDGNDLPNSPPHSVRLGTAYTWTIAPGALTLRYDYYWQDSSYGREFNTRGDEIDSWDQHNASVIFESAGGRWSARAWIRNLTDEDIVTGHFIASNNSGSFRNYFMAEPRIYGASLRYNFGNF
jgi:outer membrane receptor protein involved in Fe transport